MSLKIVKDEEIEGRLIKKRKIILLSVFLLLVGILAVVFYPKQESKESVSFKGNDLKEFSESGASSGSGRKDVGIDKEWGVANNKIDILKSDPTITGDSLKFKKAIEDMNLESNDAVENNFISLNEIKSHTEKSNCRTYSGDYVYNISGILESGYDADGKLLLACGKEAESNLLDIGLKNTLKDYSIGKLKKGTTPD